MSVKRVVVLVVAAGLAVGAVRPTEDKPIDDDGFIKTWLMLAPFPFPEGDDGEKALDAEQVKDEAKLAPKEGDKVKAGDKDLAWKKYQAPEHFFDFNAALGAVSERSVGYVGCYLEADAELAGLTMKVGSDDMCKVFLNGKQVLRVAEERALEKDQNSVPDLTLKKGSNPLVVKVVNTIIDWSGCVRFVDKDDKPVTKFKVKLTK